MKQNDFYEILPNYIKETKDLTIGSKNVLAALLFLNNNEYSKENGFFYRSNEDLITDSQVSKPTLIKSLSQLEMMGFIERKVGNRKSGASLYRLNENFTQSLKVNFTNNFTNNERVKIEGFTQRVKSDFTNKTLPIQNPNKQREIEENFTNNFTNNFTTDTDTEVDTDIDKDIIYNLNNNIIELNKNLKEIINIIKNNNKNKLINESVLKNNFTNEIEKVDGEALQAVEVEDTEENYNITSIEKENLEYTKEINESVATGTLSDKETENNIINTSTEMDIKHASTVETTKLYPNTIVEQAVTKHTPSEHYNLITPKEQERIFTELMERFMNSNSLEEVEEKWRKFIKYLNSRTFMIYYVNEAQKAHKELLKKFQPTEEPKLSPQSLPNDDGGIVAHPKGENPTDATKDHLEGILFDSSTLEDDVAPTAKSEICSLRHSNDEDGTITRIEEEKPTEAKEKPLKAKFEPKRYSYLEECKAMIEESDTIEDLKKCTKRINQLKNCLSTDEMAELAEIMDEKCRWVA